MQCIWRDRLQIDLLSKGFVTFSTSLPRNGVVDASTIAPLNAKQLTGQIIELSVTFGKLALVQSKDRERHFIETVWKREGTRQI